MRYAKHNVNNHVKVKLNDKGFSIVKERNLRLGFPDLEIKVDDDGYTTFQHHEFMRIFANEMYIGYTMPFDSQILIEVSEE
ncbi:hypothetical protein [Vagococcus fluvialis]|uniref:Uncharacterized protein n=1 Tax=Vagococcus fluvialis TaxID=2738 RepID=A0A7X6I270_9ENTE|nr:hypothetical protein [Vagococcus fluvialis]NKC67193.1 hypothetical protein [Vagococcus fluvialis]